MREVVGIKGIGIANLAPLKTNSNAPPGWHKLGSGFRENGGRMRKWRGNGGRMRKWRERENEEMPFSLSISSVSLHFLILSPSPLYFLIISPFFLHFLIFSQFSHSLAIFSLSLSSSSCSLHLLSIFSFKCQAKLCWCLIAWIKMLFAGRLNLRYLSRVLQKS